VGQATWDEVSVELGITCDGGSTPVCGDGNTNPGEECDDGNNIDGDGCSSTCTIETSAGGTNYLGTTCLGCHEDRSAIASCNTGTNHIARVGQATWDAVLVELGLSCGDTGEGSTVSGPPADHTDSKRGFMHKPGKDYPFTNGCTACHGSDLRGNIGPSCYTCHGEKWKEGTSGDNTGRDGSYREKWKEGTSGDNTGRDGSYRNSRKWRRR
jgi:cysteine-rich repeat protein